MKSIIIISFLVVCIIILIILNNQTKETFSVKKIKDRYDDDPNIINNNMKSTYIKNNKNRMGCMG